MIVIADDITGAAEIAGIAHCQGQQVHLVCGCPVCGDSVATNRTIENEANRTIVIATDTRSMTEAEAVTETLRIASYLPTTTFFLFKKTDSALRGHVVAELSALMQATGYQRAVYLPANPSKGRIIRNSTYYIKVRNVEREISKTAFSYDPEFPATTSVLHERFPDAEANGILMPDAESKDDILRVINDYNDGHTLFAGAADLFNEILSCLQDGTDTTRKETKGYASRVPFTPNTSTLILCGSTQSKPLDLGIPIAPMPIEIYDGSDDITLWDTKAYAETHSLILTIPHSHRTGKEVAVHLRTVTAKKVKTLVAQHCPENLIIEGGATAWATLQALGWTQFDIIAQIASGVVQMSATNGTLVTLKPGSYPWSGL